LILPDPVTGGELEEYRFVGSVPCPEIDILDRGLEPQPGELQQAAETAADFFGQ